MHLPYSFSLFFCIINPAPLTTLESGFFNCAPKLQILCHISYATIGHAPLGCPRQHMFPLRWLRQRARRSESERARTLRNYFIERNCFWLWIVCYFAAANYFLWLPKHRLQGLPRRSPPPVLPLLPGRLWLLLLLLLWRLFSKFNGLESHLHFFGCPTLFNIIGAVCWCC